MVPFQSLKRRSCSGLFAKSLDQLDSCDKQQGSYRRPQSTLWNAAADRTAQPHPGYGSQQKAGHQWYVYVSQMPVSECCHTDQQHSVKNITTNQLIQAFPREHQKKRGNDQAAAADRSKTDQYTDHEAYQRYLPSPQPVLGNKPGTSNWVTGEAPENHAQSHKDESSAQHTHDHVIHELHARRSLQKSQQEQPHGCAGNASNGKAPHQAEVYIVPTIMNRGAYHFGKRIPNQISSNRNNGRCPPGPKQERRHHRAPTHSGESHQKSDDEPQNGWS